MSSSTNISINSRSMNGIITLSDGTAILENGDLSNVGNIASDTIQTNSLNSTNMTLNNLTVLTTSIVPTVPIGLIGDFSASTQYVENYVLGVLVQDEYDIFDLADPTSYIDPTYVNNRIDNNTVTLIRLPDETLFSKTGLRYKIFPKYAWSNLATSITVNTITGSTFIYNDNVVSSLTMNANISSLEIVCIATNGSGYSCWVVTYTLETSLLNKINTWTGATNTFSQQDGLLARSSWATAGVIGNLNRDVGKCLTPIDYDPITKQWSINDEIDGGVYTIDITNSILSSSMDLNDFYYNVRVGRDLTLEQDLINLNGDIVTQDNLTSLSLLPSGGVIMDLATNQTVTGQKNFINGVSTSSLTVDIGQVFLNSGTQINWQYDTMNNEIVIYDTNSEPVFKINNNPYGSTYGFISIGQKALYNATNSGLNASCLAIGYESQYNNLGAGNCVSIGHQALFSNQTGAESIISIGNNSMPFVVAATECVAIGNNAFRYTTNMGTRNCGIGNATFPQMTNAPLASNNVAIGHGSGAGFTTAGCINCLFIGQNTKVQSNLAYSNSMALGYNATITSSNQMVMGGTSNTVCYSPAWFQTRNMIHRDSLTVLNANLNISTANFYEYYPVNLTSNITITLPANNSSNWSGRSITFRRVGGLDTFTISASTNDVLPANSTTAGAMILDSGQYSVKIVNMLISTGLYQWCVVG